MKTKVQRQEYKAGHTAVSEDRDHHQVLKLQDQLLGIPFLQLAST